MMKRRSFVFLVAFFSAQSTLQAQDLSNLYDRVARLDQVWVVALADSLLQQQPITVTASFCRRSLGGRNDYYSEGDYWWPNPDDPTGPYIRRDGLTNPDLFNDHRDAMRRMSVHVAALTAAYKISMQGKYAQHAIKHLRAWFINPETRMAPNMKFAQAITGICSGRGPGLIDAIHLAEPAQAIRVLIASKQIEKKDAKILKAWFSDMITFYTTHEYGIQEYEMVNNHGTCWVVQVAAWARLTGDEKVLAQCRERVKTVLLPNQLAADGSFPLELKRTKPFGYSLFNIDAMAAVCQMLSTPADNLWTFTLEDSCCMAKAMEFIVPFIADKSKWPYAHDVMYWDEWPVRHPALLWAGMALGKKEYIELWQTLPAMPKTDEGIRNFPIRQPVLWF